MLHIFALGDAYGCFVSLGLKLEFRLFLHLFLELRLALLVINEGLV